MKHTLSILLSSIIVSIFGGIIGAMIAGTILVPEGSAYPQPDTAKRPIVVSYDAAAERIPDVRRSIIKLKTAVDNDDRILYGVALSSDGWVAFPGSIPTQANPFRMIDNRNDFYDVTATVQDPAYDIWYAKSNTSSFQPIDFLDQSRLTDNLSGVLVFGFQAAQPLLVTGIGYSDDANLDEIKVFEILKKHNFEQRFPEIQQGLPVFSNDGTFIGFTTERGIVPAAFIRSVLPSLFTHGKAQRSDLPIHYQDLAWAVSLAEKSDRKRGARLAGKPTRSYPITTADGNVVRLHGGDIITSVNKDQLDSNRSLSDVIQQYLPGATITLAIEQGDETSDYSFVLSANE